MSQLLNISHVRLTSGSFFPKKKKASYQVAENPVDSDLAILEQLKICDRMNAYYFINHQVSTIDYLAGQDKACWSTEPK